MRKNSKSRTEAEINSLEDGSIGIDKNDLFKFLMEERENMLFKIVVDNPGNYLTKETIDTQSLPGWGESWDMIPKPRIGVKLRVAVFG